MAPLVIAVILAFEMGGFISYSEDNYDNEWNHKLIKWLNKVQAIDQ